MDHLFRVASLICATAVVPFLAQSPPQGGAPWNVESYHGHSVVAARAIVQFKTSPSGDTLSRINTEADANRLVEVGHSGWYLVDSKSKTAGELIPLLQADPDVKQAAGDVIGTMPGRVSPMAKATVPFKRPYFTDVIPNDPGFSNEWGLLNTGQTLNNVTGTARADIDA